MGVPSSYFSGTQTPREQIPTPFAGPRQVIDGKYRLEERLGEGALGVVHRAVHLGLEKSFAIKLLKTSGASDTTASARFRWEAVALGRLQHPHIVEVTDSGIDEPTGVPYLVMELLVGMTLADLCGREGPLPLVQALPLLDQIAGAVDAAHRAGILHRDLKPGNIFLCAAGAEPPRVKVLDFGLAQLLAGPAEPGLPIREESLPGLTPLGGLVGTPLYVAPEVIRHGAASRASDLYSFGVIAYELLGGKPPFQGTVKEVLVGHLEGEPPPLPLPPEVWRALRKALQKDPARRPRTAGDVVRRLCEGAAQAERARWRSAAVPRRVALAAFLAAALGAAALGLPEPPVPPAERWIHDLRVRTSPARAPDPRILLVGLDEESPLSLSDRADEIGRTLSRILDAGARGVAVDLLLHAKWSASSAFSDLLLRHPEDLTLAVFSEPDGSLVGADCMDELTAVALGPRRAAEIFGFVNVAADGDRAVRRGRIWFHDRAGRERLSWAGRAARELGADLAGPSGAARDVWLDTRIDWTRYSRISWREVPAALDRDPGRFRDRLVLVGEGDLRGSGDDYHSIPRGSARGPAVSGLVLQALMVDTIAAGLPVREPGRLPVLAAAALGTALALAALLCVRRIRWIAVGLTAGAGVYVALSFPVFWWTGLMLPVTAPLLLLLLGVAAALLLRGLLPSPPEVQAP